MAHAVDCSAKWHPICVHRTWAYACGKAVRKSTDLLITKLRIDVDLQKYFLWPAYRPPTFRAKICPKFFDLYASIYGNWIIDLWFTPLALKQDFKVKDHFTWRQYSGNVCWVGGNLSLKLRTVRTSKPVHMLEWQSTVFNHFQCGVKYCYDCYNFINFHFTSDCLYV